MHTALRKITRQIESTKEYGNHGVQESCWQDLDLLLGSLENTHGIQHSEFNRKYFSPQIKQSHALE